MLKFYKFVNIPFTGTAIRIHQNQVSNTSNNVAEETNKKMIEILNTITESEMSKENGSKLKFLQYIRKHYKKNGNLTMLKAIDKKMLEFKRSDKK